MEKFHAFSSFFTGPAKLFPDPIIGRNEELKISSQLKRVL